MGIGFAEPGQTQTAGTAIAIGVKPAGSKFTPPLVYGLFNNRPNWTKSGHTKLTAIVYTEGATAHSVVVLRPLNWSKVNGAVAKNTAVITLTDNPGLYSANYKYALPGGVSVEGNVADNAIAGSDYVAFQLSDGTWWFDPVSSVSGLALTMTTTLPNVTGGGINDGQILFFFGVAADKDPATGLAHFAIPTSVSTNCINLLGDGNGGGLLTLHQGDPMIVYSANATAAGIVGVVKGEYQNN